VHVSLTKASKYPLQEFEMWTWWRMLKNQFEEKGDKRRGVGAKETT